MVAQEMGLEVASSDENSNAPEGWPFGNFRDVVE